MPCISAPAAYLLGSIGYPLILWAVEKDGGRPPEPHEVPPELDHLSRDELRQVIVEEFEQGNIDPDINVQPGTKPDPDFTSTDTTTSSSEPLPDLEFDEVERRGSKALSDRRRLADRSHSGSRTDDREPSFDELVSELADTSD